MDHSAITWSIDAMGVGREREVVGVTFNPDGRPEPWVYYKDEIVVASKNLRVKGFVITCGSEGIIVGLRDPTLSPRHYKFLEVFFLGAPFTVWIGIEEVIGSSYETNISGDKDDEVDSDEEWPSPIVH